MIRCTKLNCLSCCILFLLIVLSCPCHGVVQPPPVTETRKLIAVDPGHGGQDTGVKGTGGLLEKNITLSFAQTFEARFSQKYAILLCRTSDEMTDVRSRVEAANKGKADLLISIHTGGSYIHETHGISVYYNEPSIMKPQPVKTLSKVTSTVEKLRDNSEPVSWNSVQDRHSAFSRSLATAIFDRLARNQSHGRTRLKGIPFFGMSGANMPAVMIEIGELNNPSDEKKLSTANGLNELADEIGQGINDFFSRYSTPVKQSGK